MRFLVGVLLLAAVTNAAELKSRSKQKTESDTNTKSEKRALKEGNNNGVEKRVAVLPTALSSGSPGIVYANAKDLAEKSPVQQIYASAGAPQIAKISDVLTGHGPSFPTAIASHLYSPVSIYQPRLATPTTYEVSAPVPSQLAYAEKISYQNPAQFTTQVLYNPQQQPQYFTKVNFPPRFDAVQFQQGFQQQNPRLYTHPQTFQAQAQTSQVVLNQQQPQYQNPQNVQNAQVIYSQVQQQLAQLAQTQQGIVYARQETEKDNSKSTQRELNLKPKVEQPAVQGKPAQSPNYKAQNQEAVSFASFFQGPPQQQQQYQLQQPQQQQYQLQQPQQQQYQLQQPQQQQYQALQQPQQQQYHLQPSRQQQQHQLQQPQQQQHQLQQLQQQQYQLQQPQITQLQPDLVQQYVIHVPQYQASQQAQEQNQGQSQTQTKLQSQPPSYQPQPQQIQPQFQIQIPHYQPQAQITYEPQFISKLEAAPANSLPVQLKEVPARQVVYLRQPQYQPQVYQGVQQQPQVFQGSPNVVQPAFPAVQYFGKFAQDIFGGLQQNH